MPLNLATVLGALPNILPLVGQATAVAQLVQEIIGSFDDEDQETIREEIAALADENDEGHRRLQEKLAAAAKR